MAYIKKLLKYKDWLDAAIPGHKHPVHIPMHSDLGVNRTIEQAESIPANKLPTIEKEM